MNKELKYSISNDKAFPWIKQKVTSWKLVDNESGSFVHFSSHDKMSDEQFFNTLQRAKDFLADDIVNAEPIETHDREYFEELNDE